MAMPQALRELLRVANHILSSTQIVGTHNGNIVSLYTPYFLHTVAKTTSTPSPFRPSRYCAPTTPTPLHRSPPFPSHHSRARRHLLIKSAHLREYQIQTRHLERLRRRLAATLAGHNRLPSPISLRIRSTLRLHQ